MNRIDLIFITTFSNRKVANSLIESLSFCNKKVRLLVILVSQNGERIEFSDTDYTKFIQITIDTRVSLSNARNIAIRYLLENGIEANHYMFPDDDSLYDESFFLNYFNNIELNHCYLIDVYCTGTKELYKFNKGKNGQIVRSTDYEMVMSVNMVVDNNTFKFVGFFDEALGVGAKYGSGEDIDYFFRCIKICNSFLYNKVLNNFHPKALDKFRYMNFIDLKFRYFNYGKGMIFVFYKHDLFYDALKCTIRALGGSLVCLFKFDFRMSFIYFLTFFSRISNLIYFFLLKKFN
jgi:hypothetical protein